MGIITKPALKRRLALKLRLAGKPTLKLRLAGKHELKLRLASNHALKRRLVDKPGGKRIHARITAIAASFNGWKHNAQPVAGFEDFWLMSFHRRIQVHHQMQFPGQWW